MAVYFNGGQAEDKLTIEHAALVAIGSMDGERDCLRMGTGDMPTPDGPLSVKVYTAVNKYLLGIQRFFQKLVGLDTKEEYSLQRIARELEPLLSDANLEILRGDIDELDDVAKRIANARMQLVAANLGHIAHRNGLEKPESVQLQEIAGRITTRFGTGVRNEEYELLPFVYGLDLPSDGKQDSVDAFDLSRSQEEGVADGLSLSDDEGSSLLSSSSSSPSSQELENQRAIEDANRRTEELLRASDERARARQNRKKARQQKSLTNFQKNLAAFQEDLLKTPFKTNGEWISKADVMKTKIEHLLGYAGTFPTSRVSLAIQDSSQMIRKEDIRVGLLNFLADKLVSVEKAETKAIREGVRKTTNVEATTELDRLDLQKRYIKELIEYVKGLA